MILSSEGSTRLNLDMGRPRGSMILDQPNDFSMGYLPHAKPSPAIPPASNLNVTVGKPERTFDIGMASNISTLLNSVLTKPGRERRSLGNGSTTNRSGLLENEDGDRNKEAATDNQPATGGNGARNGSAAEAGVRLRNRRRCFEVVRETGEEIASSELMALQPLSDPVPVHIRYRGLSNLFVAILDGSLMVSPMEPSQRCQATFCKQSFFHEDTGRVLTSLLHVPTRNYLAVSPGKHEVVLMEDPSCCGSVVSLNRPTPTPSGTCSSSGACLDRPATAAPPHRPLSLRRASSSSSCSSPSSSSFPQQLPQACLFEMEESTPHVCLQPAVCEDRSLDRTDDGQLEVVQGRVMAFTFLSARHACNAFHGRRQWKKCSNVVLVVFCRR